jgi:hypothetical protein
MKNIHLIPTDKPSRLYEFGGEYHLQIKSQENFRSQHIYITSDEEIKDGDCIIYKNKVSKIERGDNELFHLSKKIILTTDLDLIKDGIQAIDDTFLEWFVKNPSCESVEIRDYKLHFGSTIYKIIIPQEELKQETFEEAADLWATDTKNVHPADSFIAKKSFIQGAKIQQKQDKNKYSEEEVLDIINSFEKLCYTYQSNKDWFPAKKSEWFEQFKKK